MKRHEPGDVAIDLSAAVPMALPPATVSARDALMKYKEQWEHLASSGQVLFSRVNAYRFKSQAAFLMVSAAVVVAVLSQWLPNRAGALVGVPVGKVAGWFESKPDAPVQSIAPTLKPIQQKLAPTFSDAKLLPTAAQIDGALQAAVENLKKGAGIEGCDTASKLTDPWSTTDSAVPHCRTSSDKSRLWVWGAMSQAGGYAPFMAVLRKDAAGAVTIYNVGSVGAPVGRYQAIDVVTMVPRAVAADFSELTEGAK